MISLSHLHFNSYNIDRDLLLRLFVFLFVHVLSVVDRYRVLSVSVCGLEVSRNSINTDVWNEWVFTCMWHA